MKGEDRFLQDETTKTIDDLTVSHHCLQILYKVLNILLINRELNNHTQGVPGRTNTTRLLQMHTDQQFNYSMDRAHCMGRPSQPKCFDAHRSAHTYLQRHQSVAVVVGTEHIFFDPGFRSQTAGGAGKLGRSDDVTGEGFLHGRDLVDRARHTQASPAPVVSAPGHPSRGPAAALMAAPRRLLHHGLQTESTVRHKTQVH